jgi:hypothetical protein
VRVDSTTARSIAPKVAVVVATMHFVASRDPFASGAAATKTRGSFTMVQRDRMWKIVHFQNTVIDPRTENDDLPAFAETGFPPPRDRWAHALHQDAFTNGGAARPRAHDVHLVQRGRYGLILE